MNDNSARARRRAKEMQRDDNILLMKFRARVKKPRTVNERLIIIRLYQHFYRKICRYTTRRCSSRRTSVLVRHGTFARKSSPVPAALIPPTRMQRLCRCSLFYFKHRQPPPSFPSSGSCVYWTNMARKELPDFRPLSTCRLPGRLRGSVPVFSSCQTTKAAATLPPLLSCPLPSSPAPRRRYIDPHATLPYHYPYQRSDQPAVYSLYSTPLLHCPEPPSTS